MDDSAYRRYAPEADEMPELRRFRRRHRSLADRVERLLMQLVILGLVALVLVQTLQVNAGFRQLVNRVEALEGIPWSQVVAWQEPGGGDRPEGGPPAMAAAGQTGQASLSVMLVSQRSAPEARLLVDGRPVATFAYHTATVRVRPGQRIAVDGRAYRQRLRFRVVGATGLERPALGLEVTTAGNERSIGVVEPAR